MEKRIKIAICGDADAIEVIQDSLKTTPIFEIENSDSIGHSDIIYWLYGKGPSMTKYFLFWIKKNPLIINHWIGSDVLNEMEIYQHGNRMYNFFRDCISHWKMKRKGLINLAVAPWLVDELSKININAIYLPLTTIDIRKLGTVDDQPVKDIDFLSYVLFRRFDFYGGDKIVKLAETWKNYNFLIIFADLNELPYDFIETMPKNITFSSRVDRNKMSEFYQRSKFFIRYTQHDGLSLSVLEALYYNLHVLWTHEFPFTIKIDTHEKLSDSFPSLIDSWQPNYDGHAYVIEHFSVETWKKNFVKIVQKSIPRIKND
jgi:hypothetical protein